MRLLSLFSGAGGLDVGFHQTGFEIIGCVEIEKIFCETLERNFLSGNYISSSCRIFNQDIATFDTSLIAKPIDFIIGGPPCQTYSASGRRIGGAPGIEDPRGQLFQHYCHILNKLKPQGFLFENVRGLLGVNNGDAWKTIVKAFAEVGYSLYYQLLDAAAYGVPQHRERIILVGVLSSQDFLFPKPLFGPDSSTKKPYITAGEALVDLQVEMEPYYEYDGKYGYLLSGIPEGMNYSFYTAEMGHTNPVFAWRSKFSSFLYKLAQDKPAKTLQAQLGKFAGPFHWKNRRLTVAELKRLQSFPDSYEFAGSYDQVSRQIGNSVPPILSKVLAQAVVKQIFDQTAYPDLELMPTGFRQTFDARKGITAAKTRAITKLTKANLTTSQLTLPFLEDLFDKKSQETQLSQNEEFIFRYNSPVKKKILTFTEASQITKSIEYHRPNVVDSPSSNVEVISNKTTKDKLEISVRNLDNSATRPTWKLNLKLLTPLNDGINELETFLFSSNEQHIYMIWDAIEEAIKQRSAYISLVALYGHFAEPKIKFAATLENLAGFDTPIAKLIEFFTCFEHCGRNVPEEFVASKVDISKEVLSLTVRQLRNIRYDIRSHQTNPRIPEKMYFCAYPFPELSAEFQLRKPV